MASTLFQQLEQTILNPPISDSNRPLYKTHGIIIFNPNTGIPYATPLKETGKLQISHISAGLNAMNEFIKKMTGFKIKTITVYESDTENQIIEMRSGENLDAFNENLENVGAVIIREKIGKDFQKQVSKELLDELIVHFNLQFPEITKYGASIDSEEVINVREFIEDLKKEYFANKLEETYKFYEQNGIRNENLEPITAYLIPINYDEVQKNIIEFVKRLVTITSDRDIALPISGIANQIKDLSKRVIADGSIDLSDIDTFKTLITELIYRGEKFCPTKIANIEKELKRLNNISENIKISSICQHHPLSILMEQTNNFYSIISPIYNMALEFYSNYNEKEIKKPVVIMSVENQNREYWLSIYRDELFNTYGGILIEPIEIENGKKKHENWNASDTMRRITIARMKPKFFPEAYELRTLMGDITEQIEDPTITTTNTTYVRQWTPDDALKIRRQTNNVNTTPKKNNRKCYVNPMGLYLTS